MERDDDPTERSDRSAWELRRSAYRTLKVDALNDLHLDAPDQHSGDVVRAIAEGLLPPVAAALSAALALGDAVPRVALGLAEERDGAVVVSHVAGMGVERVPVELI